jgi:hypothetical protein
MAWEGFLAGRSSTEIGVREGPGHLHPGPLNSDLPRGLVVVDSAGCCCQLQLKLDESGSTRR